MIASAYGVTSNAAPEQTSASSQAVTVRTELPQASRVVSPASCEPHLRGLGVGQLHEVKLNVLARRHVSEAARVPVGDVGDREQLLGAEAAEGNLDADHLHVRLTLAVDAAQQAERPELIRAELTALESVELLDELRDVALVREFRQKHLPGHETPRKTLERLDRMRGMAQEVASPRRISRRVGFLRDRLWFAPDHAIASSSVPPPP